MSCRAFHWISQENDIDDAPPRDLAPQGNGGETVTFAYGAAGSYGAPFLHSVQGNSGGSSVTYASGMIYDEYGGLREVTLGTAPATVQRLAYHPPNAPTGAGRLAHLTAGTNSPDFTNQQSLLYSYDEVGNILTIADWVHTTSVPQTQSFSYDHRDRLSTASASGGNVGNYSESTTYDTLGNISSKVGVTYSYQGGKPHAVTHLDGIQRYWYDANGNQVNCMFGGVLYTLDYNAENQLVRVRQSNSSTTRHYVYDGQGNRVKATINGVTTVYLGAYAEYSGATLTKHYFAGERRVAMRQGATLSFLLTDHLGSTTRTLNSAGAMTSDVLYRAWGTERHRTPFVLPTSRLFTGQIYDVWDMLENPTGIYFYNARYYDPALQRFIQPDTIVPGSGPLTASPMDEMAAHLFFSQQAGDSRRSVVLHELSPQTVRPCG